VNTRACQPGFPAAPLVRALRRSRRPGETLGQFAGRLGVSQTSLEGVLRRKVIGDVAADRWAVVLGLHPVLLWPDQWPISEEDG
jgi:lambda repressor-like predicted transcriptional regulator